MRKYIWDTNYRGKRFKRKYFIPDNRFFEALLSLSRRINGPLSTQCLEWCGRTNKRGYGSVHFQGKERRVNRVAWMLHFGEIPARLEVCHRCDNPSCFEPSHLFLGTHSDNMRDAAQKKRIVALRGKDHWNARLTNSQVRQIRRLYKTGPYYHGKLTAKEIAARFKISKATVYLIEKRVRWPHLQ